MANLCNSNVFKVTLFFSIVLFSGRAICIEGSPRIPVSLVSVLSESSNFIGHDVTVVGYLDGPFLFLSKDHASFLDYASSVLVQDNTNNGGTYKSSCGKGYVKVYARLRQRNAIQNELIEVQRIINLVKNVECFSRQ
ncbi:hypothetical protein [Parahaliea mediterranea]|uniref:Uncharacterized protein n=1 Tax=Parahaliea mediterranea TaxID=651086 RepID=A0A939DKQ4_9GAMM|nr:hypothetical protein [Parahaliea mediterranea]MBN7799197.1 hypothetical protein [Parahaliea mediterranea]